MPAHLRMGSRLGEAAPRPDLLRKEPSSFPLAEASQPLSLHDTPKGGARIAAQPASHTHLRCRAHAWFPRVPYVPDVQRG